MQLSEVMTRDVDVVAPTTTLREAAKMMRDGDYGLLPIGENDRLIGTITDRDMVIRGISEGRDPATTTVRDAMSTGIRYCYEDQPVEDAARIMREQQIRRLAVLNRDKRLVGIVSLGDLAVEGEAKKPSADALSGISRD